MHLPEFSAKRTFAMLLLSMVTLGLTACGGGGGGETNMSAQASAPDTTPDTPPVADAPPEDQTGVVGILIKDAPDEDFTRIIMRITRVQLLRDDGEPVTVFEGDKEIDLLKLQNFSDMLALADNVPVGEYQKIRLQVTSITLYYMNDADEELMTPADVPANGKVDLNPRGSFTVTAGQALLIEIDLDAKKSIHIVGTGNERFKFRPVVFVDIDAVNRLVKASGVVGDKDDDVSTDVITDEYPRWFDLCEVEVQFRTDLEDDDCVRTNVLGHTRIFDPAGEKIDFDQLARGQEVTVIGLAAVVHDDDDDEVSTDDLSTDEECEDDDVSIDEECDDNDDTVRMVQINALVIQQAATDAVLALEGKVATPVNDRSIFEFAVLPGQDIDAETVAVLLQPDTRILDAKDLSELDKNDIQPGVLGEVIGVVRVDDPDKLLRAALIFLKLDDKGPVKLTGVIQEVRDDGVFTLTVDNADPAGDQCIAPVPKARYFVLKDTEEGIEIDEVDATAVKPGLGAAVFGLETNDDGCFEADVIVLQELDVVTLPI